MLPILRCRQNQALTNERQRYMVLTIITPTYNRSEKLKILWQSLLNQTNKEFEWLIVDDGSTDNTRELIEQLQSESNFLVRYIYKNNGGKHTALNLGIKTIESDLTFIVDSDDYLKEDAVDTIIEIHNKYYGYNEICGYSFLRAFPDGNINGKHFNSSEMIGSYINIRINSHDTNSDKAEVFYTRCLKEFPFPEYTGEKFLGEDIVWVRMGRKYQTVYVNKVIYVGNYLEDGLTKNRRKSNITSPIGCMHRAEEFLEPDINIRYRIKAALQYIIYGKFAGMSIKNLLKNTKHKILIGICILPGIVLYRKWKGA